MLEHGIHQLGAGVITAKRDCGYRLRRNCLQTFNIVEARQKRITLVKIDDPAGDGDRVDDAPLTGSAACFLSPSLSLSIPFTRSLSAKVCAQRYN